MLRFLLGCLVTCKCVERRPRAQRRIGGTMSDVCTGPCSRSIVMLPSVLPPSDALARNQPGNRASAATAKSDARTQQHGTLTRPPTYALTRVTAHPPTHLHAHAQIHTEHTRTPHTHAHNSSRSPCIYFLPTTKCLSMLKARIVSTRYFINTDQVCEMWLCVSVGAQCVCVQCVCVCACVCARKVCVQCVCVYVCKCVRV